MSQYNNLPDFQYARFHILAVHLHFELTSDGFPPKFLSLLTIHKFNGVNIYKHMLFFMNNRENVSFNFTELIIVGQYGVWICTCRVYMYEVGQ